MTLQGRRSWGRISQRLRPSTSGEPSGSSHPSPSRILNPCQHLSFSLNSSYHEGLPRSQGSCCIVGHMILLQRASYEHKPREGTSCPTRVLNSVTFNSVSLGIFRHKGRQWNGSGGLLGTLSRLGKQWTMSHPISSHGLCFFGSRGKLKTVNFSQRLPSH